MTLCFSKLWSPIIHGPLALPRSDLLRALKYRHWKGQWWRRGKIRHSQQRKHGRNLLGANARLMKDTPDRPRNFQRKGGTGRIRSGLDFRKLCSDFGSVAQSLLFGLLGLFQRSPGLQEGLLQPCDVSLCYLSGLPGTLFFARMDSAWSSCSLAGCRKFRLKVVQVAAQGPSQGTALGHKQSVLEGGAVSWALDKEAKALGGVPWLEVAVCISMSGGATDGEAAGTDCSGGDDLAAVS